MGTLFGYYLAEHNDVTLVDVRGDVVETINKHGVQIDDLRPHKVLATREPSKAFTTNYLFVFVKAPYTLGAVRPFAGQLNPATPIVSLQNGLGNEEAIKTALGANVPLVIGITNVAAYAVGHGRSRRLGTGTTVVGSGGASTETVRSVQPLLQQAGLECSPAYQPGPPASRVDELGDPERPERRRTRAFARPRGRRRREGAQNQSSVRRSLGVRSRRDRLECGWPQLHDDRSSRADEDRDRPHQRRDRRRGSPDWSPDAV